MALADIREQIKTIISATSGVGRVHDYERFAKSSDRFKELFKAADGTINAWSITRAATAERDGTGGYNEAVDLWVIRGYRGVDDEGASELDFQDTIENVRAAFRGNYNLNNTCEINSPDFGPETGAGIQVREVGHRIFFGILCHYCELALGTQSLVAIT